MPLPEDNPMLTKREFADENALIPPEKDSPDISEIREIPYVLLLDDDPFNLLGLSSLLKQLKIKHEQEVLGENGL